MGLQAYTFRLRIIPVYMHKSESHLTASSVHTMEISMTADPGFSFMNISGDSGHRGPSITKSIKAHVMRRYRQQE